MSKKPIPKSWFEYADIGEVVDGTRFIPFKAPVSEERFEAMAVSREHWFTVDDLIKKVEFKHKKLGLVQVMFIIIELRDHENKSHDSVQLKLQPQTTVEELKARIGSIFYIVSTNQRIFCGDKRIDLLDGPLKEVEIEDKSTLVLRHSLSSRWSNYLSLVQGFRDANDNRTKKEKAIELDEMSKKLEEAGLFDTYISFETEWIRLRKEYATFLDNIPTFIKEAAKSFFIRKFSDKLIDVEFKDKPSGTRSGAMCIVSFDKIQRIFYVKTNHNASSISITHRGPLNMIELFIYKYLEVINVGSVIEYVPNIVASDRIVYICGEEITGFKTMAMLEKNWKDFERKMFKKREDFAKSIIQCSLLSQILGLADLNPENIGFIESNASLCIVDFRTAFIDTSVGFESVNRPKTAMSLVAQLKMNLGRFLDLVKEMTFEEQLKIGKDCIVQWEISSKLDVALGKLNEEKKVFNRADLLFNEGTETVKEYITIVREKINQINNL